MTLNSFVGFSAQRVKGRLASPAMTTRSSQVIGDKFALGEEVERWYQANAEIVVTASFKATLRYLEHLDFSQHS